MKDMSGSTILGRYKLNHLLGQGSMGAVYAAEQVFTGREVALKFLHEQVHREMRSELIERFRQEARIVARVRHPNVVELLDGDVAPEGAFLVFERLEGQTVGSVIRTRGPLPPLEAISIAIDLLDALDFIHDRGIVHRDLKPDNVFLCQSPGRERTVKLLDFGVSKVLRKAPSDENGKCLTVEGQLLGTLGYMSPEHILRSAQVDARADLWSVGATIFRMVTGRLPYAAVDLTKSLQAIVHGPTPSAVALVPWLPTSIDEVLSCSMERDLNARYQNARQMRDALRKIAEDLKEDTASYSALPSTVNMVAQSCPPAVPTVSMIVRESAVASPKSPRRHTVPAVVCALLVASLLGTIAIKPRRDLPLVATAKNESPAIVAMRDEQRKQALDQNSLPVAATDNSYSPTLALCQNVSQLSELDLPSFTGNPFTPTQAGQNSSPRRSAPRRANAVNTPIAPIGSEVPPTIITENPY